MKWESVPELNLEKVVDINLLPKEAFSETFVYTLTEPLHHRGRAFRFRVEVDESNPDKTVAFEFVVPLSPGTQFDERSVRTLETGTRREQWKPEAPLAPTGSAVRTGVTDTR